MVLAVVVDTMLAGVGLAASVAVEHLIDGIALALSRPFAIVERLHLLAVVSQQGVAQDEVVVKLAVAPRREAGAVGGFPMVGRGHGIVGGRTGLDPDKLPVVIEVVSQELTALECGVAKRALCCCAGDYHDEQRKNQFSHHPNILY